jgi:hypothetical protein
MMNASREEVPMNGGPRFRSNLQAELLNLLRPANPRLERQVSEQVRPRLQEVGRSHAGRPAAEIVAALEEVVRSAGARPDRTALTEFAEEICRGGNPFD